MSAPFTPPITSVTIATGGTWQELIPAETPSTPRQSIMIQPQTEACYIQFDTKTGGLYLAQYQIAILNAADFPQIKSAVNVVSATTSSVIVYTYGAN